MEADVRQLRPEGYVQTESELESFLNIGMGHNAHGRGLAASFEERPPILHT